MKWLVVLLAVSACTKPAQAPPPKQPTIVDAAVLGQTFTIQSKILGEQRVINVYLPPDYAKSGPLPVLYMPDGGMDEDFPHVVGAVDVSIKNAIIRPLIVVGVKNTVRRRDLAPETVIPDEQKAAPLAGGTGKFRAFLRDELKPEIARRYKITAESGIVGESAAGLFIVETFVLEPTLFDHYIACDPSVWWNEQHLVRTELWRIAGWDKLTPKTLYMANSSDGDTEGVELLTRTLGSYAPPVTWWFEPMPDERHGTIFPRAALRGIRKTFAID
jgi:predicted alpha/beta superfamily hydrolase